MTDTPQAVISLEYASPKGEYALHPSVLKVAKFSLWTAILSGLAVGSCLLSMWLVPITPMLHVALYATLILIAVRCGIAAAEAGMPTFLRAADAVALLGLVMIGVAPVVAIAYQHSEPDKPAIAALGVAFLFLGATAFRAVLFYREIAAWVRPSSRRLARMLVVLGWAKAIYETLWLLCCAAALLILALKLEDAAVTLAFGGLFGLLGFAGIWVWMMVVHAIFLNRIKWLLK